MPSNNIPVLQPVDGSELKKTLARLEALNGQARAEYPAEFAEPIDTIEVDVRIGRQTVPFYFEVYGERDSDGASISRVELNGVDVTEWLDATKHEDIAHAIRDYVNDDSGDRQ